MGPRDKSRMARGATRFARGAVAAAVGFEAWGMLAGHSSSSAATLTTALVIGGAILGMSEVARRSARWSLLWVVLGLCGPLYLLLINLEAPEPGVAGQIGLLYPVVFCALYLRPSAAWLVAGATVLADLDINASMFGVEPALFNTAAVSMVVVTVTLLMTTAVGQQDDVASRLSAQASVDPLTSLATRRELERAAAAVIGSGSTRKRDRHPDQGVALLVVDLDHFKVLNDTYGHPAGDRALVHVAGLVRRCAGSSSTVARLGGDELAVLLADRSRESAGRVAQCIVDCIGSLPVEHSGASLQLSASVGVSHVRAGGGTTLTDLYAEADEALYRAKLDGRSRFAFAP